MENQETFTMIDENGKEQIARILNIVEINHQEYLIYAISKNDEEENVYVEKIIKDQNGNENVVSIENEEERNLVFEALKEVLEKIEE